MFFTRLALVFGAGFPAFVVLTSVQFLFVAPGTSIRPIGWAGMVFGLSAVGLLFIVPLSIFASVYERRVWLSLLAGGLSLTPFFLGRWMLLLASRIIGFEIAP